MLIPLMYCHFLKNLDWYLIFCNELVKTQMPSIGTTTQQKDNDQQQHAFSLLYVYSVTSFDIL